MELELKNIEKRLCYDKDVIRRTLGTKLSIYEAKIASEVTYWKKL